MIDVQATSDARTVGEADYICKRAVRSGAALGFSMTHAGSILELDLKEIAPKGVHLYARPGTLLAVEDTVHLGYHSVASTTLANLYGMPHMIDMTGKGKCWLSLPGGVFCRRLVAGESICINPVNFLAASNNTQAKLISAADTASLRTSMGQEYTLRIKAERAYAFVYGSTAAF